jgi:hypothetical protein
MSDEHIQMREFMEIALSYTNDAQYDEQPQVLEEDVVPLFAPVEKHPLIEGMETLVSTLRSHMENEDNQDVATGVEMGMNRAADMIENLIRRHGEENSG